MPTLTTSTRDKLTVTEVCKELGIQPRTFYEWRQKGCAPKCKKLPNGSLRISRADLDAWYNALPGNAA